MSTLSSIIDRRLSKGKSSDNRKKFLDRVRDSVREAMPNILNKGSLKDIAKDGGEVEVKKKTISEPNFRFGKGGENDHILPGNKEFVEGDKLKKPQSGQGQGNGKSAGQGEGEDPFVIQITREEFLNYLFEDLELPDLVKKELSEVTETRRRTAGYSTTGTPARLSIPRSMKMAFQRRLALRGSSQMEIDELLAKLATPLTDEERLEVEAALKDAEARKSSVPFIDTMDMRFRSVVLEEEPITSATMVCIMDNSGSMGQREKTLARKFFYLLYLFLNRKYDKIELVFLHHTDTSKEVSEEEFFNTRESGGTIVSTALELLASLIPKRIDPSKTNIYVCQCSDGDNFTSDNQKCANIMKGGLLGKIQYWAYIQIEPDGYRPNGGSDDGRPDTLWRTYREVGNELPNLVQRHVGNDSDIYPVFRKLFERKDVARKDPA